MRFKYWGYGALFCILWFGTVRAQNPAYFFHTAARQYIDARFLDASQTVQQGLKLYPNDPDLKKLAEKLKKKQQQQQQNEQQQQQQAQQKKQQKQDQGKKKNDRQKKRKKQNKQDKQKMDKKEAMRILNALKNDELKAQKKKAPLRATRRGMEKDW